MDLPLLFIEVEAEPPWI